MRRRLPHDLGESSARALEAPGASSGRTALRKQREAADALLLGRVTFEQMGGYWPLQTDDTTGITDYLNDV
jgi:dihydrofolate reductase